MDAGVLEQYLRDGLSLEKIGKLTGRHPSTVGYWVKQHGLAAVHRDRHAPKGGIDKDTLTALVDAGLTTRQIADRLGFSQSTVRHWLRRHGLRTHRARPTDNRGSRGVDVPRKTMECARHGSTEFWLDGRGAASAATTVTSALSSFITAILRRSASALGSAG
jgi:transposase